MKYTYLLIDFFTAIIPFIFSFHPKLNFYKTWKAFFPAVIITGMIFILWDVYFTSLGVWGFNSRYLIGVAIGNMPVEEILFSFAFLIPAFLPIIALIYGLKEIYLKE
ncbi:lycopene cyclase domain-containing protein [Pedobacter panaciterrae]